MLLTVLQVGAALYAVEARHVVEVIPLLRLRSLPQASPAVAGVCNYRGAALPVVDLNRLAGEPPAPRILSTRLLVVRHGDAQFAVLAAGVTGTIQIDAKDFLPATMERGTVPWLGQMAAHGSSLIQRLEIDLLAREIGACA